MTIQWRSGQTAGTVGRKMGAGRESKLYGSGSVGLMKVDREVAGKWRSAGDSRPLSAPWGAPEDSVNRDQTFNFK